MVGWKVIIEEYNRFNHNTLNTIYEFKTKQDAMRNSVQSLAQSQFSHKELQGLSCDKLKDKLIKERNINWDDLEVYKKIGIACYNRGEEHSDWVVDFCMPILTQDRGYINKHIFIGD